MTTYTLKKTTGNNAFFNTIQNIKMDSDFEKFRIVINGFGHGTLTYDILNKITALNSSRLSMKMDISSKGLI
jgi:hypothetical protein